MAQLQKSGLFKRVTLYDYQAMCKNAHHHASGARPLLSPFYGLLAIIKWFFSHFVMFLLEFNICGLWHNDYVVDAKAGFHASEYPHASLSTCPSSSLCLSLARIQLEPDMVICSE
ncbi:voltage-dependent calcium channel subunit alpha-2/delta-3-like [Sinocyclocheilus rhinocerous]|uniref:voltage-dependent calcium channel subunit alpha-2/delta-3-like n=1 Tax=Sinocyclocheilus rhinocerous TaxID=307959 RepID=UPI0007B9FE26|nr:PREDICTED: voltage-dependent calcium channel subunit alpha-2/delta-3-like [Sinocyclocheilus rhinocerous]